jgi:hypothetical protein
MVLVEYHTVKAKFLAIRHLFEVLGIIRRALQRVEVIAGNRCARRLSRHVRIGEEIKVIKPHGVTFFLEL